jgi:hypothetical protein
MGLFSTKKPEAPAEDRQRLSIAADQRGTAVGFRPAIQARLADIANTKPEMAEQRGYANADVAQRSSLGTSRLSPFQRAMQRGSALSRIARAGDGAIEMQQLRDRMAMSKFGDGLQRGAGGDYSTLAGVSAMYNAQKMRESQNKQASTLSMIGTLGGMGANAASGMLKRGGNPVITPGGTRTDMSAFPNWGRGPADRYVADDGSMQDMDPGYIPMRWLS